MKLIRFLDICWFILTILILLLIAFGIISSIVMAEKYHDVFYYGRAIFIIVLTKFRMGFGDKDDE